MGSLVKTPNNGSLRASRTLHKSTGNLDGTQVTAALERPKLCIGYSSRKYYALLPFVAPKLCQVAQRNGRLKIFSKKCKGSLP